AFGVSGAFGAWEGWLGLAVALASWIGLVGLVVSGKRATRVVSAALAQVSREDFPVSGEPDPSSRGRFWRVTRAIPMKGRAVQSDKDIDYWGDGQGGHAHA